MVGSAWLWLALEASDESNGAVRFYRGSHHLGLQHQNERDEPALCGRMASACGEPQVAVLSAGQASIHSDLCAHIAKGPNRSSRRRLGIAITFTQMDGVTDGGLGWATGVAVPEGSTVPLDGPWVVLQRPSEHGPSGFSTLKVKL